MPFTPPPALPPAPHVREEFDWTWRRGILWNPDLFYCDPTRHEVDSFRVGNIFYRMLRPLYATFEPAMFGKPGRLIIHGLESQYLGKGSTFEEARENWELQIDSAIQELLATQDFERTLEQKRHWHLLCEYFDLNEIRYSRPLKIRAYGRLLRKHSNVYQVRWIDGSKHTFTRDQVADEMAAFRINQSFEAVLLRDPRTWQLLRIESAFPTSGLPAISAEEADELLSSGTPTAELPELEWD